MTIRIAQLSDTHFLEDGEQAEGGFAYDTAEAFDAVHGHIEQQEPYDLVVVTGDIADHGRTSQYHRAAEAFGRLTAPINVCPGNHDQTLAFTASLGRPRIAMSRAIEIDEWCFLFVDSNAGVMVADETGQLIDPDYESRLHANGSLGPREAAWVRNMCRQTTAEHVFIWLHHPPGARGLSRDDGYSAEWQTLLTDLPKVRGLGAGHTHVPALYPFEGRPVHVAPSLKNNFDLEAETLLPPGYRSYEFSPDGQVTSQPELVDDERWPRHPLGRAVMALMRGELTWDEFNAIVARKSAAT